MKTPTQEPDERTLIEAAQRDPRRFGELYESYFHPVYAFVARRVRSRQEAEDLTSEVFHQALAHLGRFEWRGVPLGAWLLRIAANAVADHSRRAARESSLEPGSAALDGPDPQPDEEARLEEAERRARLYRLVDRLPGDQRRVIVMRFADEKSIREIAQEMGRSEGAVKQLQFRALDNLRARMGETHG